MSYTLLIPHAKSQKTFLAGSAALLTSVCALLYGMTLAAPLIYDDVTNVGGNPMWSLPGVRVTFALLSRDYFALTSERTYQPLVTLFHFLTHESQLGYRRAGFIVHALNGWLVLRLGLRSVGPQRGALSRAALLRLSGFHGGGQHLLVQGPPAGLRFRASRA